MSGGMWLLASMARHARRMDDQNHNYRSKADALRAEEEAEATAAAAAADREQALGDPDSGT